MVFLLRGHQSSIETQPNSADWKPFKIQGQQTISIYSMT